ncbi:Diaminohydroxyphosphoribosylamino-pyrimidine deaminase [Beauveria bassiana]|nr:Diaminohydroxyphosphoribosylamino-pyrimidine deaminase [Beauveria bassiana]KAH8718743.1 Diaminohydroxyphosphoribosylamino-pyrimidine deaminase [Beauveria bassiana]
MTCAELLESLLKPEIEDADEETFLLYSQPLPSSDLGFVDPRARTVEARVGGVDYTIHQSPGVLSSDRAGGTTGADWLASPTNFLFSSSLLDRASTVLELGCGISPLNALALAPRVAAHLLTDQAYVQRLVQLNIDTNMTAAAAVASTPRSASRRKSKLTSPPQLQQPPHNAARISFETLDWETDQLPPRRSYDAVLACDCVYNDALIAPLVQTCVEACRRRQQRRRWQEWERDEETAMGEDKRLRPSLCIVAQQLRDDDVFRAWLAAFVDEFRVWRVSDDKLPEALRPSAGFVVHIGILRE